MSTFYIAGFSGFSLSIQCKSEWTHICHRSTQFVSNLFPSTWGPSWELNHTSCQLAEVLFCPFRCLQNIKEKKRQFKECLLIHLINLWNKLLAICFLQKQQYYNVSNSSDRGLGCMFNIRMQSSSSLLHFPMYTKYKSRNIVKSGFWRILKKRQVSSALVRNHSQSLRNALCHRCLQMPHTVTTLKSFLKNKVFIAFFKV